MLHFSDLKYSAEELEQDSLNYLKTQIYMPCFVEAVKEFIYADLCDFKSYYDDDEYVFQSVYYDEYAVQYDKAEGEIAQKVNFKQLALDLEDEFSARNMSDEEIRSYILMLDAEFKKNAYCSHMEPYFLGYDGVIATVFSGYACNPIFSIYSMVREWAMALHLKKMYPEQMRKFGYRYQLIRQQFSGEERFRKMLDFRNRYKITMKNIGMLRAVHSSLFAYTYLYLRAFLFGESAKIEDFIMDTASSQIYLLLQGEDVQVIDFPLVKEMLKQLKNGRCRELIMPDGAMDWDAIYDFANEIINNTGGMENLRALGFEGIAAKTIRSFWNKSANMQKMLKILRNLALDNSDPIINRLIEMCEYRLGRPNDKSKKRMERFIEHTRRIMAAYAYELTRPRTIDQTLIAAFPSVFLVYFQWHHNLRNIYPRVPKKKINEENTRMKSQAEDQLKNKINADESKRENLKMQMQQDVQRKNSNDEALNLRLMRERELFNTNTAENKNSISALEKAQKQNSL